MYGRGCAGKNFARQYGQEFCAVLEGDSHVEMQSEPTWWLQGRRTGFSATLPLSGDEVP